ncbi:MAG TPA: hypothetical protein VFE78_17290 [Gemmataceae bacterium]|nr:hypothetical protein [Gemmataceae bacterium]
MVQTCIKCSRANPADAVYCYFDGFVLSAHGRNGGPVAVGAQAFASPFVFPGGRTCRSFDELALACQEEWAAARDLLRDGYLERFFGGLGRVDLARAAQEAARFPDADRGLDQLLTKLPGDVLEEPKLRVEPQSVSLGVLKVGEERRFDLHLENAGMRLLYGSVSCADNVWLALGEAPGSSEKLFQFGHESVIPVHVRGDRLRANNKPVEARLLVESNGGAATVVVRAEVPVKPFPAGALGGAKSPRQVAEKAKAAPKEAALLFEDGSVERWYKDNGWTYPVQGPASSGLAAVQQFFEALGLTPAPKVQISERKVVLQGNPGDQLSHALEVKSEEKRPVYAHAVSDQPWLEVGRAKLNGRTATIRLAVPAVPHKPGETLTARLTVQSNGNQRFVVPVTLQVGVTFNFGEPEAEPVVAVAVVAPDAAVVSAPAFAVEAPPARPSTRVRAVRKADKPLWTHLLPALLLLVALLGVVLWDVLSPRKEDDSDVPDGPGGTQTAGANWTYQLDDREPRLGVQFNEENERFGIVMLKERDPKDPDKHKRLTYKVDGSSCNTCLRIDGSEMLFGKKPQGQWVRGMKESKEKDRLGWKSVMDFTESKVRVTQHVEIVPGEQSRTLDTCLVWYTVENRSTVPHKVGLRMMLDTFIGANDGVPFTIPGQKGLLTTLRDFGEKKIPDYVEALERPDPQDPGTVARLGLKGLKLPGIDLEPIHSMTICRWPGSTQLWELTDKEKLPMEDDSCVFLYWAERSMAPRERRHMAFTYGLGKIAVSGGASTLGLTAGGSFRPGGVFTVTAYVKNPRAGQKVKLDLPGGLSLLAGESVEQKVETGGAYSQVSWRVRADALGAHTLTAVSGSHEARTTVRIKNGGIFDTN